MKRNEPSYAVPVLVVLMILALLTASYFSVYFLRGEAHYSFTAVDLLEGAEPEYYGTQEVWRVYRSDWQATIFQPARWIESWLTGKFVEVVGPSRVGTDFDFSVEAGE